MKKLRKLLDIDSLVQKTLFLLIFLSVLFLPFIGVFLCILGGWQMISALIFGIYLNDTRRKKYFGYNIGYLSLLGLLVYTDFFDLHGTIGSLILGIAFVVVPIIIAFWYLKLTGENLKIITDQEINLVGLDPQMDKILDSNEILNQR